MSSRKPGRPGPGERNLRTGLETPDYLRTGAVDDLGRGKLKGEIIYPQSTIESEHTLVVVSRNVALATARSLKPSASFFGAIPRRGFLCSMVIAA
jgi:hypothetical protein